MKKLLLVVLLTIPIISISAQESLIKEYAESRRPTRWMNPICLYPSTLRMINVAQDPNFNKMVNDIEKVLIYNLDSATVANKDYKAWLKSCEEKGFEEYITVFGKQEVRLIGRKEEYIGLMAAEGSAMAFYLRGEIPFEKIPALMETFRSDNVLSLITDQFK